MSRRKRKSGCLLSILLLILFVFAGTAFLGTWEDDLKLDFREDLQHELEMDASLEGFYDQSDVYYYYNTLDEEEKEIYETLLYGISERAENITILDTNVGEVKKIMEMFWMDHPEVFWFTGEYQYVDYETKVEILPGYPYDGEEIEARIGEVAEETENFMAGVDVHSSEYDKIRQVYEYVIDSVDYVEDSSDNQSMYSALVNKESVCAGYSREVQYLLQNMGIQCLYVTGQISDRGSHGWNIVRCDGEYYHVDATFGDVEFSDESFEGSGDIPKELLTNYGYLCTTDERIYKGRSADHSSRLPACTMDNLNYYRQTGHFYDNAEDAWAGVEDSIWSGEDRWICQFSSYDAYARFLEEVEDGEYAQRTVDYLSYVSDIHEIRTWHLNDEDCLTVSCWY